MKAVTARSLLERLDCGERFLSDGAMGSELIAAGIARGDTLHANVVAPDAVSFVHRRYIEAGATFLTANTFGMPGPEWEGQAAIGVDLAVRAARGAKSRLVWVSVYPDALINTDFDRLCHAITMRDTPPLLLIETCVSLRAALSAIFIARCLEPEVLAVTCHFDGNGCMPDGTTPETAAVTLAEAGADIVGANCGEQPSAFVQIARQMRHAVSCPLLFQPSAGLPIQDKTGSWSYPLSMEGFTVLGQKLVEEGVNIIGGCCGTSPAYIGALHKSGVLR